ncbi:MAG: hypothetical protein D3910_20025 [Candidatus Electrothrix sp. ATG2]|nr:hypothetical protein [Candidatus Electrothrix sp. ATG2]
MSNMDEIRDFFRANKDLEPVNNPKDRDYDLVETPCEIDGIPVIREWEQGKGSKLIFSRLDSCLGLVWVIEEEMQGIHFSQVFDDNMTDETNSKITLDSIVGSSDTLYAFGGSCSTWKEDYDKIKNLGVNPLEGGDVGQKRWLVELDEMGIPKLTEIPD